MDAKLTLSRRETFGKKAKILTADGKVLANIFGKGRESIAAYGDSGVVEKVVAAAGKNHPIIIDIQGNKEVLVLVHEVERDFITRKIHHVSFQVVIKGQKVTTAVPVHLIGDAPAVKSGLMVVTLIDSLEVEAIPSNLPNALEVSIEHLEEDGDSVHVSDIAVVEGVDIKAEDDQMVAKVETPRAQVEEEPEEDEEDIDAADIPSDHGGDEEDGEAKSDGSSGDKAKE